MTTVDTSVSLRQRREAIVYEHAAAENRHDVEATIATFHKPRYEFNGRPSDGAQAVRELLGGFMAGFPDFHIEPARIRHLEDGVLVEGTITGTHAGEWAGIPPTGRSVEIPVVGIFEFDDDRLLCEKVHMDMAELLSQIGALPCRSSENRRVVAATVEDADNHQYLVEDGEGDDHSATKADRPQTWPNVVTGFASVREEGQLLAEGDDRIRVTVGGFR